MTIAITGSTGQLGRLVIDELLAKVPATELVAIARDPAKAAPLKARGIAVRVADYDKPETLAPALAGIDTLVLISASEIGQRERQHSAIIAAAKVAGIKLVIYTSIVNADSNGISLAGEHRATEAALKESGLPTIVLRNSWYMENYTADLSTALDHGVVNGAAGEGRISAATRADFAAAIAAAATGKGEAGKTYELGGDSGFTLAELAAEIAQQSGKPVRYNHLSEDEFGKLLASFGLPPVLAADIANWDTNIAQGALRTQTGDLGELIGRPTTTMAEAVSATLARQ